MTGNVTIKKLLVASGNKGKIKEITELLKPLGIEVLSATDFNVQEPEETGQSFIENATLKARYYAEKTKLPALADDSGLCVNALGGRPGIYSARLAGPSKDFSHAMQKIESELGTNPDKSAYFACALALYVPDTGYSACVEGVVRGNLTFPPRGTMGFGYDPIFIADGYNKTFAEIAPGEKHKISHRARAFAQLLDILIPK